MINSFCKHRLTCPQKYPLKAWHVASLGGGSNNVKYEEFLSLPRLPSLNMDGPKDDFKWFGEGFDGFPKRLPDDCVEYTICIIDSKLSDSEIHDQLRQVQTAGTKLTNELLKDFLWQREGIQFDLTRGGGKITDYNPYANSSTKSLQVDVSCGAALTMETLWKTNG